MLLNHPLRRLAAAILVFSLCAPDAAMAQAGASDASTYPVKPIRVIVGFTPGGGTDTVARLIGQKLNEVWGKPVVIDNRPGAGGLIAIESVARAAPDGYTMLFTSASFTIQPSLSKKPSYDPVRDFSGVSLASSAPYVVVVNPAVPVANIRELIQLAKAKPGALNYASSGTGSGPHLAPELFKKMAEVDIVHVPYKGATGITEVIAGAVQLAFAGVPQTLPHMKSGRLRGIAVTSAKRFALLPELPTIAESGVPNYDVDIWYGLVAPAATPLAVRNRLSREIANMLKSSEMKERFASQGVEPRGSTPGELESYIRREIPKWAGVVKAIGLQPE